MTNAGDVYEAELVRPAGGPAYRLKIALWTLAESVTMGFLDGPSLGDLVVRRRDDDTEVVRVSAGVPEEASALLEHVRHQLETLSCEDFEERWSISVGA